MQWKFHWQYLAIGILASLLISSIIGPLGFLLLILPFVWTGRR